MWNMVLMLGTKKTVIIKSSASRKMNFADVFVLVIMEKILRDIDSLDITRSKLQLTKAINAIDLNCDSE